MPEPKRWADTEEARKRLAILRETVDSWKSAGYDVSELDAYLQSPDMTSEGVTRRLAALVQRINRAPECPKCYGSLAPNDIKCPSCDTRILRPGAAPEANRCPECKSRLRPDDRKCPVCGRRLRPWALFS